MGLEKITLVYFDIKGRAEVTRILLNAAGKDFEDKRVTGPTWEAYKPNAPMGQLPVLEIDGKRYTQSHAFNRYLAEELGFGGKNSMERLQIDTIIHITEDVLMKAVKVFFEKDEAKKAELLKEAKEGTIKNARNYMEKLLKENGTGFCAGDRLTLADIYLYDLQTGMISEMIGPADDYPMIKALVEKVGSNPKIAAYVAKRK